MSLVVIRNLEVIGEAVKHLSQELRNQNPEIPRGRIAGMRDVLVHGYFGVDMEIVREVVQNRLSTFKRTIEVLLRT